MRSMLSRKWGALLESLPIPEKVYRLDRRSPE
jgi:hypothetical protein